MPLDEEINNRFTFHPVPNADTARQYERIRAAGKAFATVVGIEVPHSREQSSAITKIDEAVMWANAGIARNPAS